MDKVLKHDPNPYRQRSHTKRWQHDEVDHFYIYDEDSAGGGGGGPVTLGEEASPFHGGDDIDSDDEYGYCWESVIKHYALAEHECQGSCCRR